MPYTGSKPPPRPHPTVPREGLLWFYILVSFLSAGLYEVLYLHYLVNYIGE